MTVLGCIVEQHNIWLVLIAACICATGSWATIRVFHRAATTRGVQRIGWHILTAVASGAAIWCTHFVAMIGFDPGVPVGFDPVLTILSLLVAVIGAAPGFVLASSGPLRFAPAIGGGLVGLAIVVMHYTGMMAYRVQGVISWDVGHLMASIVLAVVFWGLALHVSVRRKGERSRHLGAALLVIGIVSLHFTGMTAFEVSPMMVEGNFSNPEALRALGMAVACVAAVVVVAALASYIIDQSVRTESLERLRYMALNDSLTGLPNRASFNERIEHELNLAWQAGRQLALVGIDLDRFKEINDLHGHAAGDKVLKVLARRMNYLQSEGEFIARLGGDEFMAIYRMRDQRGLMDFISRLEAALTNPIRISDYEVVPGASLGVAIYPDNADNKNALISNADLAMYRAKSDITGAPCFYEESMDAMVRARRTLAGELREALHHNQLDIHFQVQTLISTGEIRGYEALLRWEHPERGFISPAEFIPIAEENGLILQIGEWVLRNACARAATWQPGYKVAVNISPIQFAYSDLPKLIRQTLAETGLPANQLELELTESTIFIDKERSAHMLRQIKALGVSIALDDFGTGYSSLDTLRSFPFDKIKLDRSFMSEIEHSQQAKAIIRAVLALGKSLDIPVLAEGIETEGQLTLLNAEGCDEAQGFLLGHPEPLDRIVENGQLALVTEPAGTLAVA